ncbi:hypothetical protein B0T09DRAFT_165019 [Sordaria sp. MPI-SDFR-AT-0083]|nr:hypothetical protein B0T09DRAFT_165019 [Sordaria sp. MPI-SDFR-AT-0083]
MKSTTFFITITMAHMALCVPVPWMAGDKILPLLNNDAPSSGTSSQSPKKDNRYVLASSHIAPGPVFQRPESSFSSLWDNWKKKHGSGPIPNLDNLKKDIPVLIITEMGELGVGIPLSSSSNSKPLSKQASSPKQKPVSIPPSNEKADNLSVTEMGELTIGIPSPVPSPPPLSSLSSSPSSHSSSRPSNGTSPCPFYVVSKPRDHNDVLVIFLVLTFLLVVVVVEAGGPVCRSVRDRFVSKRKGAIRLVEEETESKPKSFRNDEVLVKSESG